MISDKTPGIYCSWQLEPNDCTVCVIEHVDDYGEVHTVTCSVTEAATLAKFLLLSPLVNAGLKGE